MCFLEFKIFRKFAKERKNDTKEKASTCFLNTQRVVCGSFLKVSKAHFLAIVERIEKAPFEKVRNSGKHLSSDIKTTVFQKKNHEILPIFYAVNIPTERKTFSKNDKYSSPYLSFPKVQILVKRTFLSE